MSIINVQHYHVNINKNIFFGKIQSQISHQFYSENNHLLLGGAMFFFICRQRFRKNYTPAVFIKNSLIKFEEIY